MLQRLFSLIYSEWWIKKDYERFIEICQSRKLEVLWKLPHCYAKQNVTKLWKPKSDFPYWLCARRADISYQWLELFFNVFLYIIYIHVLLNSVFHSLHIQDQYLLFNLPYIFAQEISYFRCLYYLRNLEANNSFEYKIETAFSHYSVVTIFISQLLFIFLKKQFRRLLIILKNTFNLQQKIKKC